MLPVTFIEDKKRGHEHSQRDIKEFLMAYVEGKVPDYQVAAWLMAVNFQGMTDRETIALVEVMLHSGETIDLSGIPQFKVDKHSTGGVGDKVSLILAPVAVAAGCVVPMISGRGLGHSGGTLDKLESIPGFDVHLSKTEFIDLVRRTGMGMMGQTQEICPADRKMYALRDVTATVKSIPLICGSILSKKIAEGIDGLVLDVKTGNGAFLATYEQSRELAQNLKKIGEHFGLKVKASLTDMSQPLGAAVGNWLEVVESIEVLKGGGPRDLREVTLHLAAWMIALSGIEKEYAEGRQRAQKMIDSGAAYDKFVEMVRDQGGDVTFIEKPEKYPKAPVIKAVTALKSGYLHSVDTTAIGMTAVGLGAGRITMEDRIQPEMGLLMKKNIGDSVDVGEELAVLHAPDDDSYNIALRKIREAIKIREDQTDPPELFYETF